MGSRLCAVVVALMLALTLGSAGVAPASAKKPEAKYSQKAFKVTNKKREANGVAPVRQSKCLQKLANQQAKRMASQRRLFHQDLGPVLSRCQLSSTGENVGFGFPDGRAIVQGWMKSSGHRTNLLNPRYRLMAIGARKTRGVWYVAQVFGSK